MNELSVSLQKQVEQQFHNFCMTILRNETRDIYREYARQKKHEKFLEDLTLEELLELSVSDELKKPTVFVVGENFVLVRNEALALALEQLAAQKRELILLYFFLNKTDQEIAELYDMIRQTVTYQRKSILKQLRLYLEMDDLL